LEDPELPVEIYVGYESETLKVKLDVCEGYLRKIVQDVSVFQRGLFPLRFFRYSRQKGTLEISNSSSDINPKHKI
jgi:hypothetical protein